MKFFANSKREWFLIGMLAGWIGLPALAAIIATALALTTGV